MLKITTSKSVRGTLSHWARFLSRCRCSSDAAHLCWRMMFSLSVCSSICFPHKTHNNKRLKCNCACFCCSDWYIESWCWPASFWIKTMKNLQQQICISREKTLERHLWIGSYTPNHQYLWSTYLKHGLKELRRLHFWVTCISDKFLLVAGRGVAMWWSY